MKKIFISLLALLVLVLGGKSQQLDSFSVSLQTGGNSYLSIAHKKAYTRAEAASVKQFIDFELASIMDGSGQKMEWYNMSGTDKKTPKEMKGTATLINAISFDNDQFINCKTNQDLKRMTGHLTNRSFAHFASVSDNIEKGIDYHCFIIQMENGKRALMWIDLVDKTTCTVIVKTENRE